MPITHDTIEKATREVVAISAGLEVRAAAHHSHADTDRAELIGTLSLLGALGGTLVIYSTWERALEIAVGMLGASEHAYDDDTVRDAMGEIINQIGGTIKRSVAALGAEMLLSPPVVVSGSPLSHRVRSPTAPICVDLEVGGGSLCVCLWPA